MTGRSYAERGDARSTVDEALGAAEDRVARTSGRRIVAPSLTCGGVQSNCSGEIGLLPRTT